MTKHIADTESTVAPLYQDSGVAQNYVRDRFSYSWQVLLHSKQVSAVRRVIHRHRPARVLEIAPGPARIAVDLDNVNSGYMVEYSSEMIQVAKHRLLEKGKDAAWTLIQGNAFALDSLPELPGAFDLIYTFRFIRHFQEQDRARLYLGMKNRLNTGGLLIFDVVNRPLRAKLDAASGPPSPDSLPVYDISYTEDEFRQEMNSHGFTVFEMMPVLRHFRCQSWISSKFDDVITSLSSKSVNLLESIPSRTPLEWVAVCGKL